MGGPDSRAMTGRGCHADRSTVTLTHWHDRLYRHGGRRPAIHAFVCTGKKVLMPASAGMTGRQRRRVNLISGWYKMP
jgi:hypothetical protein